MSTRRRFTANFTAKVALMPCVATRRFRRSHRVHKVHVNQVSHWKRQAMDGLGALFSNGVDKAVSDHEAEVHDLHAKIGQLTVERDFLARGLKL